MSGTTITAEDRRAATGVTTSQSGHRFEIQLGHLCNNRCVFCSSGQLTALKIARPVPIEPIIEALEQARAAGATHLTFLGGEPTIHKRFLEALSRAVELGFEHIVIFTNGVMFPHPGFIESVTALGNFEWRISIQGATEEAHVATTERPQSFQRILHGLAELQRRDQLVTANMCVNERSYRSLPHYPELLARYGVRQLHVDIVRPESTGERNEAYLLDIMPRYSDMAPFYAEMLAGFERVAPDFDINVGNLPYCVLPEWAHRIHHGGQETVTKSSDGVGLEDEMNKYDWQASLRRHLPSCDGCVFRARCTGIFRVYLELHGGDEFQPLSHADLLARDPQRRNQVLLLEPTIAALRAGFPAWGGASGWRWQGEASDERRGIVDITLARGGGQLRLRFTRPGARNAVIQGPGYAIEGEASGDLPTDTISALLGSLHRQLLGDDPRLELSGDAVERCLRNQLIARGRQRVQSLSRLLRTRLVRPGWRLDALRWVGETRAELAVQASDGTRVEVGFDLGTRGDRSRVSVDFRAVNREPAAVKPVIDDVILALKERRSEADARLVSI